MAPLVAAVAVLLLTGLGLLIALATLTARHPAAATTAARVRAAWERQVRLWDSYNSRYELSGLETRRVARQLRWRDGALYGDLLPARSGTAGADGREAQAG